MRLDAITLCSVLGVAMLLCAIAAFFYYVSPLTIGYVGAIVVGMAVMLAAGVQLGHRADEGDHHV